MSTRGIVGFRIDGTDRLTYNHYDSYPEGLGEDTVAEIRVMLKTHGLDEMKNMARRAKFVEKSTSLTVEEAKKFQNVCQNHIRGSIRASLELGVMSDDKEFILDSLMCEWVYVLNFDDNLFEVYQGFQDSPHSHGRYAALYNDNSKKFDEPQYYPCALIATFRLDEIPSYWASQLPVKD